MLVSQCRMIRNACVPMSHDKNGRVTLDFTAVSIFTHTCTGYTPTSTTVLVVIGQEQGQAANLAGFRASEDPRFEAGIPDFMNGILNFSIHFNVVHRKVDWRNPKMKSLNSMPEGRTTTRPTSTMALTLVPYYL